MRRGRCRNGFFEGLANAGLPVIGIETRHAKEQPNKTDRNDARGIAQMVRVNLYRPVHVKARRRVHCGKQFGPAHAMGLHDPPIEIGDQPTDRLIEFNQAEEAAVAKACQHPSLGSLDRNFDF